jgi:cell division protein FtsB
MTPLLRKVGYAGLLGMLGVYAYMMATGPRGIPALWERQEQIEELEQTNAELLRDNEQHRSWIRDLEEDRETQQLETLRRLNKKVPGTQPFYLSDQPAESSADE